MKYGGFLCFDQSSPKATSESTCKRTVIGWKHRYAEHSLIIFYYQVMSGRTIVTLLANPARIKIFSRYFQDIIKILSICTSSKRINSKLSEFRSSFFKIPPHTNLKQFRPQARVSSFKGVITLLYSSSDCSSGTNVAFFFSPVNNGCFVREIKLPTRGTWEKNRAPQGKPPPQKKVHAHFVPKEPDTVAKNKWNTVRF